MDFDPDDAKVQALQGQRDRMMGFGPCPWCETKRRPSGRRKGCARGVRGAWRMRGPARSSRGRLRRALAPPLGGAFPRFHVLPQDLRRLALNQPGVHDRRRGRGPRLPAASHEAVQADLQGGRVPVNHEAVWHGRKVWARGPPTRSSASPGPPTTRAPMRTPAAGGSNTPVPGVEHGDLVTVGVWNREKLWRFLER